MTVFRRPEQGNYFTSKRNWAQDPNLSNDSVGLLARMLSMPDNWDFHQKELRKRYKEGEKAIKSAMKGLVKYGYLLKLPRARKSRGKWGEVIYEIYDCTQIKEPLTNEDSDLIFRDTYSPKDFYRIYSKYDEIKIKISKPNLPSADHVRADRVREDLLYNIEENKDSKKSKKDIYTMSGQDVHNSNHKCESMSSSKKDKVYVSPHDDLQDAQELNRPPPKTPQDELNKNQSTQGSQGRRSSSTEPLKGSSRKRHDFVGLLDEDQTSLMNEIMLTSIADGHHVLQAAITFWLLKHPKGGTVAVRNAFRLYNQNKLSSTIKSMGGYMRGAIDKGFVALSENDAKNLELALKAKQLIEELDLQADIEIFREYVQVFPSGKGNNHHKVEEPYSITNSGFKEFICMFCKISEDWLD